MTKILAIIYPVFYFVFSISVVDAAALPEGAVVLARGES